MDISKYFSPNPNKQQEDELSLFLREVNSAIATGAITGEEYMEIYETTKNPIIITKMKRVKTVLDRIDSKLNNKLKKIMPTYLADNSDINQIVDEFINIGMQVAYTACQKEAVINIINFLYNYETINIEMLKCYGLFGYAGTGKTTLIVELVCHLMGKKLITKVAMTAPTNKAVNVMKSRFANIIQIHKQEKISIDFITIHKLLQYENDFTKDGEKIFVKKKKSIIDNYDIVIVDECSMISQQITDDLLDEKNKNAAKLIFVGDPAQLPPVFEETSQVFGNETLIAKINKITLQQIVRTSKKNMMELCKSVRKWLLQKLNNPNIWKYNDQKSVFVYKSKPTVKKEESEWFEDFLKSENSIILTWSNNRAHIYNTKARQKLFKKTELDKYEVGDKLILNEFYKLISKEDGTITNKFYTSEQICVININIVMKDILKFPIFSRLSVRIANMLQIETKYNSVIGAINRKTRGVYKCWKLTVYKLQDDKKVPYDIYVIHPESIKKLEEDKKYIQFQIKSMWTHFSVHNKSSINQIETHVMKKIWKLYDQLYNDPFASVDYGYCITCHKSQGSTYYNVYVDAKDILSNSKPDEAKRCVYTALTRGVNEVRILV